MSFRLGQVVMTCRIAELIKDPRAAMQVLEALHRYKAEDWGDLPEEDKELNRDNLEWERNGQTTGDIMGAYATDGGKIWIVTEWDRSVTTIMLPEEWRWPRDATGPNAARRLGCTARRATTG